MSEVDEQVEQGYAEAPPIKVCPSCSVQSATDGPFCPHCGTSFSRTPTISKSRRKLLIGVGLALLLIVGGAGVFLKVRSDNQADVARAVAAQQQELEDDAAAAAAKAAEEAADAEAAAAAAQNAADDRERAQRALTVTAVEDSIKADATDRVAEGTLVGPILSASCTPVGGGSLDDLTAITGNLECIAVNEEEADGSSSGYRFSATVTWATGSYQWHLGD